jgi:Mor family transcriptional regulator
LKSNIYGTSYALVNSTWVALSATEQIMDYQLGTSVANTNPVSMRFSGGTTFYVPKGTTLYMARTDLSEIEVAGTGSDAFWVIGVSKSA